MVRIRERNEGGGRLKREKLRKGRGKLYMKISLICVNVQVKHIYWGRLVFTRRQKKQLGISLSSSKEPLGEIW